MKRLYNGKIDLSVADPTEIAYYCETCKIQMDGAQQVWTMDITLLTIFVLLAC